MIICILLLAASNKPRIPKLQTGTEVYALEEEVRNILGQECVAIATDRSSGSGILWSYDGEELLVVTAAHLMTDFETGELELWSGEKLTFSEKDVQLYTEYDLAFITLDDLEAWQQGQNETEASISVETLRQEKGGAENHISQKQPQIGDSMWVVDSVYGSASGINTFHVYSVDLYLDDYGTEMLLLSGSGIAGMSGCPIYDMEGKLVAMMSGMSEDGTILAAVPVAQIVQSIGE